MIRNAIYAVIATAATALALFLTAYSVIPTSARMLEHPLDTSAIVQPPTAENPGSATFVVDGTRYTIVPDLPPEAWPSTEATSARVFYSPQDPAAATLVNPSPFVSTMLVSVGLSGIIVAFAMWRLFFTRLFESRHDDE